MCETGHQVFAGESAFDEIADDPRLFHVPDHEVVRVGILGGLRRRGSRLFMVVLAMHQRGKSVPRITFDPFPDVENRPAGRVHHHAADLPEGAGLSSSAALGVAVVVAALRLLGRRLPAAEVARVAYAAEHDVLGVPSGALDQRAVVGAPGDGALLLDFRDGGSVRLPWAEGTCLVAVDTVTAHDVGGEGYRTRRMEADAALRLLEAVSWRDLSPEQVEAAGLPEPFDRRARHITSETLRAGEAAVALRFGDAEALGRLMSASHASLRDDYEVSTPELDACCAAAEAVKGCLGARLVGAGFGGTAIALARSDSAETVRVGMLEALGRAQSDTRSWLLEPSPGAAELAADVVI